MTMITPSYLGETIEYSSLHACRSTLEDPTKFVETVRIARRCHRTIMQNFVGTLVVDTIGVGLAAFGLLNPLLAAFIHVSSEMTFILNSARLLPPVPSANKLVRGLFSHSPAITD